MFQSGQSDRLYSVIHLNNICTEQFKLRLDRKEKYERQKPVKNMCGAAFANINIMVLVKLYLCLSCLLSIYFGNRDEIYLRRHKTEVTETKLEVKRGSLYFI